MQLRNLIAFAAITLSALCAADMPYAGKWKFNVAKSDFSATTVTYQKLAGGEWQATAEGVSYKFKMDGKDYPDNLGDMVAWKEVDANTWEASEKTNDKHYSTDTLKLGADGILTIHTTGTKPNGDAINDSAAMERVGSGTGLAGKWKTKSMQSSSPEVIELVATGGDGLAYRVPAYSLSCDGKLDGKDYPCTGPATAPGWGVALAKSGANSFTATVKKDGKPLFKYSYTTSADGKTLTVTGSATGTNEKAKMVYDRQ